MAGFPSSRHIFFSWKAAVRKRSFRGHLAIDWTKQRRGQRGLASLVDCNDCTNEPRVMFVRRRCRDAEQDTAATFAPKKYYHSFELLSRKLGPPDTAQSSINVTCSNKILLILLSRKNALMEGEAGERQQLVPIMGCSRAFRRLAELHTHACTQRTIYGPS
jgi:hypothetical protein